MKRLSRSAGFTLIELMMVVAIIAILSSMALPKFANMVRRSREATTKGNLGALRSALFIYSGDNEGSFPINLNALFEDGKYLARVPEAWTNEYGFKSTINNGI